MINKKDLKKHSWYVGCGRGSNVARWDGATFLWPTMGESGTWGTDAGRHYEDGGCFRPMEEINEDRFPTVGQWDMLTEDQRRRFEK